MNLKERNMIYRVFKALDAVPGAHIGGGTRTTTVSGVTNFGADMQELRTHVQGALQALFDGSYSAAQRDTEFEEHMGAAEKFIQRRAEAGWRAR